MFRNVKILDCTLRDGGRIINCGFPQFHIDGIARGLTEAGIDIIEMGFLRGDKEDYNGDSTFFTEMEQARRCIPAKKGNSIYVLFVDYGVEFGMWDFDKLPECDGETITGIRLGFRKKDFFVAIEIMKLIQDKGYSLFLQLVETRDYSDLELVQTLLEINKIKPHAVGLVDTFGRMYKDDLIRMYTLADHNLDDEITIDFHAHNNMQLSFSFAQEIVGMSRGKRKIVLDATLDGMGKGAGNLNTELIVEYMNSQYGYKYNLDRVLDTFDEHIHWIKNSFSWGYSIPSLMSGLFSSHPNNVSYLLGMSRLQTKDIRYILSMIDPQVRKRYDYENIDRLYLEYSSSKYNDTDNITALRDVFRSKSVLIVVFGETSRTHSNIIHQYIEENSPVIISVNHIYNESPPNYIFYGNSRRYSNDVYTKCSAKRIITSNIKSENEEDIVIDYSKVISIGYPNYDNSTIMLLNLLHRVGVKKFVIAGLDGYQVGSNNYSMEVLGHNAPRDIDNDARNTELKELLKHFADSLTEKHSVCMLTPSMFESVFESYARDENND